VQEKLTKFPNFTWQICPEKYFFSGILGQMPGPQSPTPMSGGRVPSVEKWGWRPTRPGRPNSPYTPGSFESSTQQVQDRPWHLGGRRRMRHQNRVSRELPGTKKIAELRLRITLSVSSFSTQCRVGADCAKTFHSATWLFSDIENSPRT